MDIETASEASSDEDSEVEMGGPPRFEGAGARFSLGGMQGGEEDAEGEEDMDMTQVVYGGIARRASMAASNADEEVGESMVDDDEKTMDFTLAIGGVLPNTAPAGASTLRNSIGYSFPSSPNSAGARLHPGDAMEGEMDMSMDETVALGGIIGADDSLSSGGSGEDTMANRERTMTFSFNPGNNDDDGMDMTVAGGGIIGFPVMSSALPSQAAPTSPTSTSAKLATGTPSFARPTMSSAQKTKATEKRNVFAPSPSPYKSTTPRGGVMDAAGDVAKRLSFGSTTSSGGKKRARENDDETSPAKRRSMVAEEVFGVPTPPMGTPKRTVSPRKSPRNSSSLTSKSPARSPMLRRVLGLPTNDQEEREGQTEWDTPPTITLAAFLEMAGVQFMEGLPGLTRRRSSVAKGLLGASGYGGNGECHDMITARG
jgi:kinetochore protein Spc7/SPC105